jgi:hypothetical protein
MANRPANYSVKLLVPWCIRILPNNPIHFHLICQDNSHQKSSLVPLTVPENLPIPAKKQGTHKYLWRPAHNKTFLSENYPNPLKKKENPETPGQGKPAREKNLRRQKTPLDRRNPPILTISPILKNYSPPLTQKREKARTSRKIVKKIAKNTKIAQKMTKSARFLQIFTKKYQFFTIFLALFAIQFVKTRNF